MSFRRGTDQAATTRSASRAWLWPGSCAVTANSVSFMEGDCSAAKGGRKDPVRPCWSQDEWSRQGTGGLVVVRIPTTSAIASASAVASAPAVASAVTAPSAILIVRFA